MARTSTITVPDELKTLQGRALEQRDRFILGVVQSHKHEPSIVRKRAIRDQSLFKYLAGFWSQLTTEQKQIWKDAAAFSSLSNWQLFISDNAARLRNDLTFPVAPSNLWQVRAGRILIESPASEIILKQEHPLDYWVTQKIVGKPWKEELVLLTENFSLPLSLEIRYKSNLTAEGGTQSARYFARVRTSYQGEESETDFSINFSPSVDWTLGSVSTSGLRGILIGYTLFVEIIGYRGELLFDNIRAVHGGTNWARDPRCQDVDRTFSGGFAVVPPFWIPVSLPTGSQFFSVYPPSL